MQRLPGVLFFAILTISFVLSSAVEAAEYSVRPFLIDKTLEPREEITETVVLTNNHNVRRYVVFATVNEISVDKEGEIKEFVSPVMTDRAVTVTSWIEVTRGRIEIPPGETREVPLTIKVSPLAEPGEYHAFVGFVPAANRPVAEGIALRGEADGVIVTVTVPDQRKDSMRLSSFSVNRFITNPNDGVVVVDLENLGDIASAPTGEIVFYNSRGAEISVIPVNTEQMLVSPGESTKLTLQLPDISSMGRVKAKLLLDYGVNQRASLQDTTFFYIVPTYLIAIIVLVIITISLLVTYLFRRSFMQAEFADGGDEVMMYVRDGHEPNPQEHDIDLSKKE